MTVANRMVRVEIFLFYLFVCEVPALDGGVAPLRDSRTFEQGRHHEHAAREAEGEHVFAFVHPAHGKAGHGLVDPHKREGRRGVFDNFRALERELRQRGLEFALARHVRERHVSDAHVIVRRLKQAEQMEQN